jgi:hypothetical protein
MKTSIFDQLVKEAMTDQLFDNDDTFELNDGLDAPTPDEGTGETEELDADEIIGELLSLRDATSSLLAKLGYTEEDEGGEDETSGDEYGEVLNDTNNDEIEDLEKESVEMENVPDSKGSSLQKPGNNKVANNTGDLDGAGKDEGEQKQYRFVKIKKPEVKQTKTTA